ncbi:uncharacterized protein DUF4442 [Gillisia sp. Hel_I_86]|uniref:DUF4442 domain-containing protein n=1 Tax=Gillisia sp. Hel_I_86 TaxID=1249981 RepID=UPI00119BA0A4|nr:DUF4442 domain-containing protein [Gillisia sp. Hel_I_86]TVZ27598.1 uncharacterized protein DUF4442 [Gillisia sp. Hel_I_86]
MKMTPGKLNKFLMLKLPSAWLCGVRVKDLNQEGCTVRVRHKWINQNPFNSMYFAVQAMAAELSTGAMVIAQIKDSGQKISMLVAQNKASFTKKATGKLEFTCNDGHLISEAIQETIKTGEGQIFWMKSVGLNEDGAAVSTFEFEWTVRIKQKKQ